MTINLTLPLSLEKHLVTTAEVLHMPSEDYILSLVEASVHKVVPPPLTGESDEDFIAAMTMLHRPGQKPLHPDETWSRATIYQDHD